MLTGVPPARTDRPLPDVPRVCIALSGDTMAQKARQLLKDCCFFEFRLDTATKPQAAIAEMEQFLGEHAEARTIATCRRKENGGSFLGSAMQEVRLLHAAAVAGATIVDLSVETAEDLAQSAPEALNLLRQSAATLMLSWHDFLGTPDLEAVYARLRGLSPELIKIVPTATSLDDALRLLDLLRARGGDGTLTAMSMGIPGMLTRVLGPCSGSAFTFAAPDAENATAPGQIDFGTLQRVFRLDSITAKTDVYGVFGDPIAASKSPAMMNAAFTVCGIDAVYLPLQTASAPEVLRVWQALPLQGASVTMPLKEQIQPLLTHLSPLAEQVGAANTLVRKPDGRTEGHNTDASGVADPLAKRISLKGANILILGAGGAARAALFGVVSMGAHPSLLNRSRDRAEALVRGTDARVVTRAEAAATAYDAIVNATPHGMLGHSTDAPMDAEEMQTRIFFDLVYNPLETPLLLAARERGIETIPGIEMFLAQGAAQFQKWTGLDAPLQTMRDAVLRALQGD